MSQQVIEAKARLYDTLVGLLTATAFALAGEKDPESCDRASLLMIRTFCGMKVVDDELQSLGYMHVPEGDEELAEFVMKRLGDVHDDVAKGLEQ